MAALAAETVTPLTQAVTFAVIGGFVTLMTLVLGNRSKRQTEESLQLMHDRDASERRAEKAAEITAGIAKEARDYAHQDAINLRADRAARRTLRKLGSVERLGKVTHALVNSDKTAALREKLDNLQTTLVLMKEVMELKRAAGIEPTEDSVKFLASAQLRIESLTTEIDQRVAEQKAAEAANVEADIAAKEADEADDDIDDEMDDAEDVSVAAG